MRILLIMFVLAGCSSLPPVSAPMPVRGTERAPVQARAFCAEHKDADMCK